MRSNRLAALILLAGFSAATPHSHAQSTGAINLFSNGKKTPIYGIDSSNPNSSQLGGTRTPLGAGYVAELWYAKSPDAPVDSLIPVPGGRADFVKNGVFVNRSVINLPGTFGGQNVTVQIRVWAKSDAVQTWDDLLKPENANVARGESLTKNIRLGGFLPNGAPNLPASLNALFPSFGLYVVPEPGTLGLVTMAGLAFTALLRRKN